MSSVAKKNYYKYCIVPMCRNTTTTTPLKVFISVPKDPVVRRKWCVAMRRDETRNAPLSSSSSLFCCEDHFNVPEDMENYYAFKLCENVPIKMKKSVLPHKFECQKSSTSTVPKRGAALKRKRLHLIQTALAEPYASETLEPCSSTISTSAFNESFLNEPTTKVDDLEIKGITPSTFVKLDKAIQVHLKPRVRSKATNTKIESTNAACSPIKLGVLHTSTSPIIKVQADQVQRNLYFEIEECFTPSPSSSDYDYKHSSSSENSDIEEVDTDVYQNHMRKGTFMAIEKEPKLFLGMPKKCYHMVAMLSRKVPADTINILITLKKIRLNDPFSILAVHFGMSISNTSKIFNKTLSILAQIMQELILWPSAKAIVASLPIPFRARYGKVQSIIDCLEIEVEKPSNPIHQALSWSEYKGCNTIKYLISCTPCGLVNFISGGYGGRGSDIAIVEDCGYLELLSPGMAVMADRGFKNLTSALEQRGCKLIRPPSVSSAVVSTPKEVKQSKRIAALRIHVERVIGRLREFNMLLPHARIDHNFIQLFDYVIIIACGIINMQDHLIKM